MPKSSIIFNMADNLSKLLKKQGFRVLRFWEHAIINNADDCYNKLKELLG